MATDDVFKDVVILGAGPSGLAAGHTLTTAGTNLLVVEAGPVVGGLSRTIEHHGFRFDLGGHRFLTSNKKLEDMVGEVLHGKLLQVNRSSKILREGKYFDYPINLHNALTGLGFVTSSKIVFDYLLQQVKQRLRPASPMSLEDWIVQQFGRSLFEIFFQGYSAKVWGITCDRIAMEWGAQRIQGLSLLGAIKDALVRTKNKQVTTLARCFLYPTYGFGEISEGLKSFVQESNEVLTHTRVVAIRHAHSRIESVTLQNGDRVYTCEADDFVSSIPISSVVRLLDPPAPREIIDAVCQLKFRDLVVVTVMIDKERVTDQTWIYTPDADVPFGRIHEPRNWSPKMAPPGKTHLVAEFFCSKGDAIWTQDDEALGALTIQHLQALGFIDARDVMDSVVLRIARAYPILEIGYAEYYDQVCNYLEEFVNLQLIGRAGRFKYANTDSVMESGIAAAENIIARNQFRHHSDGQDMLAARSACR